MLPRGQGPRPAATFGSFAGGAAIDGGPSGDAAHPCVGCVAPCCSTVTVHELQVATFRDVDYLQYLLGFERIELTWLTDGTVEIHYRALCDHLDRATAACRVHGTDAQPLMCRDYDATACSYRGHFLGDGDATAPRISPWRFGWVAALFRYDERGRITSQPTTAQIAEVVRGDGTMAPPANVVARAAEHEQRPFRRPRRAGPSPSADAAPAPPRDHASLCASPCEGCAAPCCEVLVFPLPSPANAEELSFFRYAAAFPGLEIARTPRAWVLQCFTRCRHLGADKSCGLYGAPERPVYCRSYDPWSCRYKPTYVEGDPSYVRIAAKAWPAVEALFQLDADDRVLYAPAPGDVRRAIGASPEGTP